MHVYNLQRAACNKQRAARNACACVRVGVGVFVCGRVCVHSCVSVVRGGTSESISCQNVESADPRSPRYKHRWSSVTCPP